MSAPADASPTIPSGPPRVPEACWRRNQIAVTSAAAVVFFGFTLVLPFLPFFVESLGVHPGSVDLWSGVILSSAPFLAALMAPVWGRFAERYGMRRMAQRTMLAMTVHWLLMLLVSSVWELLGLRILLGIFSGFGTISVALVTHGVPRHKVGSVIGTLQAVQILSAATGPSVGGVLYDTVGLRATFAITAGLCGIGLLLFTTLYTDIPLEHGTGSGPARSGATGRRVGFRTVLALPGILPVITVLFWATVISRSFGLVVPLTLKELAPGAAALGVMTGAIVSAGSYAEALSAFVAGRLAARFRPSRILLASLAASVAAVVPMSFVGTPGSFAALRVLLGLAAGGALTLGYTLGGTLFPERGRAVHYSVLSSAAMLGGALGPTLSGIVSHGAGIRYNFVLAGTLYVALALLTLAGIRREPPAPEDEPAGDTPYIPVPR